MLGNSELVQCEQFVYLGVVTLEDLSCDKDVDPRVGLAAGIVRMYNTEHQHTKRVL